MNKKQTKKVSIIAAAVLAVAGAAGAMYYFTHRNSDEMKKMPLADIISDSKIPGKEYENIDLSNAVLNIPDAEKFYKLYLYDDDKLTPEECTANCHELFDAVFGYAAKDSSDITFTDLYGEPLTDGEAYIFSNAIGKALSASIDYEDEDGRSFSCEFRANGGFIAHSSGTVALETSGQLEAIIHLDRGEQAPDTKYIVGGEEYSPAQALVFAEKVMSEKLSKFLPGDGVSPTELVILKDSESSSYIYKIQFEHVYENTPYFHLSLPGAWQGEFGMGSGGVIYLTISEPDRVGEIYNMMGSTDVTNDGEYEDEYITLDAATELLSEYLAPYYKNKIAEVTIKYTKRYPRLTEWDGKENIAEFLRKNQAEKEAQEKTYLRPYWCFIMDKSDPISDDYCLSGNAFFVDMQTGEIIIYDSNAHRYVSSTDDPSQDEELQ